VAGSQTVLSFCPQLQSSCDKHRQKEGEKKQGDVSVKPEVVIVYNRRMERVDKMYQQLTSFLILMRHCVKAYIVLLF
jgi:ubiquitin C-terminal hydrolase